MREFEIGRDDDVNAMGAFDEGAHQEILPEKVSVTRLRRWFREAVEHARDWREAAREDYEFVSGIQWSESDALQFEASGRPALVINRIKPLINVLSGYQRLNRQDIDFLPRTADDQELCNVRKGITKYVMDSCDYDTHESDVFMDAAIGGLGWFSVGYKDDPETEDGEAFIHREDPFGIYIDPEARKPDFCDAKYICRAKWVDKDELAALYPDHANAIRNSCDIYDKDERLAPNEYFEPFWYQKDTKKVRLIECWYKKREDTTFYYLSDGRRIPKEDVRIEMFTEGLVAGQRTIPVVRVYTAVFMETILFENSPSRYEHGEFPFVPLVCFHFGVGDLPAGFVRDLKDPQREINKRRIQALHILNTMGNGGGYVEEDAMSPEQFDDFEKNNNVPGHFTKVRPGAIGKIQERGVANPPSALIQSEVQATEDLRSISGINESLMGTDIANTQSGRAIELRQKQAITHIAPMFDQLRKAKKKIALLLWGRRGHKGVIPQFYTADKIYRVEGENGQQFIRVNQQIAQADPLGNVIVRTLNDLSQGEFDVVVADTAASATMRQAQMWNFVDSISKLGIPGQSILDIIIKMSDLPNRNELLARWQNVQQEQAQAAQAQQQAEKELAEIKTHKHQTNITYRDAPLPLQFAMAAKEGLIDQRVADEMIRLYVEHDLPRLADGMKAQAAQQAQMAQQQQMAMAAQQQMQQQPQLLKRPPSAPKTATAPAIQSVMSGATPGAM